MQEIQGNMLQNARAQQLRRHRAHLRRSNRDGPTKKCGRKNQAMLMGLIIEFRVGVRGWGGQPDPNQCYKVFAAKATNRRSHLYN